MTGDGQARICEGLGVKFPGATRRIGQPMSLPRPVRVNGNMIFKGHKLTIGVDLGKAMKQTFEKIPRSLMALERGTHSPWSSRLLRELGHEVLVAHAQKVNLISKSTRKVRCSPKFGPVNKV